MATLAALQATLHEVSTASAVLPIALPALDAHLSSGVPATPPDMTGTATVRALTGNATTT